MLYLYLICAGFAGTFIAFTVLSGGDHAQGDAGTGGDVGGDASVAEHGTAEDVATHGAGHGGAGHHGHSHDKSVDSAFSWLPLTSLRFWTFALAFFGVVGAALTWTTNLGGLWVLLLALVVGWASGLFASWMTLALGVQESSSHIVDRDLVGATAIVLVPVSQGDAGKVRVTAKGRMVDLLATTDDAQVLASGREVLVVSFESGAVKVTDIAVEEQQA